MKKIIAFVSSLAMLASMAFTVSAASPRVYLEVAEGSGTKAGETVTVNVKYDGFDVTPYDENETGAGQVLTSYAVSIDIPGGIGTAAQGEQFLRPNATLVNAGATGSPQTNINVNTNTASIACSGMSDPMPASGTLAVLTMKLNKDITETIKFDITASYNTTLFYDDYVDWGMGDTHAYASIPASDAYTLLPTEGASIVIETEEEKTEWTSEDNAAIAADKKIVAHSENVTGVTADSKVTVTVDGESKTFGNGLGAYFAKKGIDLEGVADLAFRFAVLVDKAVESVSFVIE